MELSIHKTTLFTRLQSVRWGEDLVKRCLGEIKSAAAIKPQDRSTTSGTEMKRTSYVCKLLGAPLFFDVAMCFVWFANLTRTKLGIGSIASGDNWFPRPTRELRIVDKAICTYIYSMDVTALIQSTRVRTRCTCCRLVCHSHWRQRASSCAAVTSDMFYVLINSARWTAKHQNRSSDYIRLPIVLLMTTTFKYTYVCVLHM